MTEEKRTIVGQYDALLSEDRLQTLATMKKITDNPDLNIYSMDVLYDYDLGHLTKPGIYDTQMFMEMVFQEAAPGIAIDYTAPNYGCSAFTLPDGDGGFIMGRNYDFKFDSSAMIVRCHPKDGYASVGHAALDNVQANDPDVNDFAKLACLTSPFICIDGINEKGVGIAVLTLDSDPTETDHGKPVLATTLLIRLVLDYAASTEEAIELIRQYDIYAISGRDYHFYITDATGDGRVVEFDCNDPDRQMIVTPTRSVTNFYIHYKDKVLPNQKNGIYGHGRERYDAIEQVIDEAGGRGDLEVAWDALIAASQEPNPECVTSNTQWSIAYDLKTLDYQFVLHRDWTTVYWFSLNSENIRCGKKAVDPFDDGEWL